MLRENRVTRRHFLAGALGVAATAVTGAETAAKPIRIGCGSVVFRKVPREEALRRIRKAGFEYFETQAVGPWCPHVTLGKDDPDALAAQARNMGFKGITGLWSWHGAVLSDPKSVAGVTETIKWAKAAGIPMVFCGDGRKPEGMTDEDALKLMRDRMAQILEVAGQNQITVGLEPHGHLSLTAEGLKRVLEMAGSPWLKINFDSANVHRAVYPKGKKGAYDWDPYGTRRNEVETLSAVVGDVVNFHAKNVKDGVCCGLPEGEADLPGCFAILRKRGFKGVVALETDGDQRVEESQRIADTAFRYLSEKVNG
ncbi:MAG: sugar phosphate isomerase/epimerase [Kiritimatiellae bacterium]|nr:sugar phosphate isomerase/epimerase [Kiritimatiellia bacterium]